MSEVRTIAEAHRLFRSKELKPSELLEQCLRRIAKCEPTVHAWVKVYEDEAREQAAKAEADIAYGATPEGAHRYFPYLRGIPTGIKDVIDIFDWPTACGSPAWAGSFARRDSDIANNLRKFGAVFLGKTHTAAYALFDPPLTRNPWNSERTPGGSSSGSAAAVAAGMCLFAVGTQTGGSTIRPASYCGIAAYKPTYSPNATFGILPLAPSLDHLGFMATTVEDLNLVFGELSLERFDTREESEDVPLAKKPRLGRLRGIFSDGAEPAIGKAVDDLCANLKSEAFAIKELRLPMHFGEVLPAHRTLMLAEAEEYHGKRRRRKPEEYPPKITACLDEAAAFGSERVSEARNVLFDWRKRGAEYFFGPNKADVLLCPATSNLPPAPDTTGDPSFATAWSFLGWPVVSLPIAWSADGLPICVQLVGPPHSGVSLLEFAAKFEKAVGLPLRELP